MKRGITALLLAAIVLTGIWAAHNDFGLGRNMEILVNMMRAISTHYVDEVDPDELMVDAAGGMVHRLDPYTLYLPEEEMSEFDRLTTGKYSGVGSLIRKRGEWVIFARPYEGSPADRAGIRIGDKILAIDGKSAQGMEISEVSSLLKGDPNTTVKVQIQRLLNDEEATLSIRRERIAIPGIPYVGWVAPGIGFIQHSDFTEGCYEEMRHAIEQLRSEGELKGLILDYRSNGGGILQEAVKIVGLFTPVSTEVVRTKGRSGERIFLTETTPIAADIPLAVMINSNSASSAEIVAGALQDLDRAVLIGQKSFGKGLVQSTVPLGYNAFLKLTTGKYYIPSGRCIQAIDYSEHAAAEGREVVDSMAFQTRNGRTVWDGGGITPDLRQEPRYISNFALTLYALGFIEDFVDGYMKAHHNAPFDPATFSLSEEEYGRFLEFIREKEVPYESASRRMLARMKEAAQADHFEELEQQITHLEANLKDDKMTNLETYREEIQETIEADIALRYGYLAGMVAYNVARDEEVRLAAEVLLDTTRYNRLLQPTRED